MDRVARLTYSINTSELTRARNEIRGLRDDARGASRSLTTIGGSRRGVRRASDELTGLNRNTNRASSSFRGATVAAAGFTSQVGILRGAVAGIGTVTIATNFIQAADTFRSMNALLTNVTKSTEEFQTAQEGVRDIANLTRQPISDVTRLYARMAPPLLRAGQGQEEVLRTIETVNKAIQLSAPAVSEATSSLQQFAQAIGKGNLDGDELRSILENAPVLALQLAEGLGVGVGQLKDLGAEGKLTTDVIAAAFVRQEAIIDRLFSNLPITSGQAWTIVQNQAISSIGQIDEALGISESWSDLLLSAASSVGRLGSRVLEAIDFVDSLGIEFAFMSSILGPLIPYIDDFAIALIGVGGAVAVFAGLSILINPLTLAIAGVAAAAVILVNNWDGIVDFWKNIWTTMHSIVDDAANGIIAITLSLADRIRDGAEAILAPYEEEIQAVFDKAGQIVDTGLSGTASAIGSASNMMGAAASAAFSPVEDEVEAAFQGAGGAVDKALSGLASVIGRVAGDDVKQSGEQLGTQAADGVVAGILGNISSVEQAATELVEVTKVAEGVNDVVGKIDNTRSDVAGRLQSELDAANETVRNANLNAPAVFTDTVSALNKEIDRLSKGITGDYADAIDQLSGSRRTEVEGLVERRNALREQNELYKEEQRQTQLRDRATTEFTNKVYLNNLAITEGADAVKIAELELRGYTESQARTSIEIDRAAESQKRFSDGLQSSIQNASSLSGAIDNFGSFLEDWLKERIAYFAANKITAFFDFSGGEQSVDGLFSSVSRLFGGGSASNGLEAFGGSGEPVKLAAEIALPSIGRGSIADVENDISQLSRTGSGLFDRLSDKLGTVFDSLGDKLSGLKGQFSDVLSNLPAIGTAFSLVDQIGEATGLRANIFDRRGVIGGFLRGGVTEQLPTTLDINVSGGDVGAAIVERFTRERSFFRGTENTRNVLNEDSLLNAVNTGDITRTEYLARVRDLRAIEGQFTELFDTLDSEIATSARALGIDGGQGIFDNLDLDISNLPLDEVESALEQLTVVAYRRATNAAGPEVGSLIRTMVNESSDGWDSISEIFAEVTGTATQVVPILQAMNNNLSESFGTTLRFSQELVESLGGLDQATSQLNSFYENFYSEEERRGLVLAQSAAVVRDFNDQYRLANGDLIDTGEELRRFVEEQQSAGNVDAVAAAIGIQDAIVAIGETGNALSTVVSQLDEGTLNVFTSTLDNLRTTQPNNVVNLPNQQSVVVQNSEELGQIRDELRAIREENAQASEANQQGLSAVVGSTENQTLSVDRNTKAQDRFQRRFYANEVNTR